MEIRKMYLFDLIDLGNLKRFNMVICKKPENKTDKPLIIYFGKPGQTILQLEKEIKNGH